VDAGDKAMACMRQKPFGELIKAVHGEGQGTLSSFTPLFRLTLDSKTVFSDTATRLKEGNFIKRLLLIGTNDDGGGV
jgi:hypothetical protein